MPRLALIGASHLVALRNASVEMQAEADEAGVAATFIPTSYREGELTISDGRIRGAFSSDRLQRRVKEWGVGEGVAIHEFDAFVVVGAVQFPLATRTYAQCRGESHTNPSDALPLVSDLCFETTVAGRMRTTPLWKVANALAEQAPMTPIALVPSPFYSAAILSTSEVGPTYLRLRAAGDEASLAGSWRRAIQQLAGSHFVVLHQPTETLETPVLTREVFSVGPKVLAGQAEPVPDYGHMNTDFGKLMLQRCLDFARTAAGR